MLLGRKCFFTVYLHDVPVSPEGSLSTSVTTRLCMKFFIHDKYSKWQLTHIYLLSYRHTNFIWYLQQKLEKKALNYVQYCCHVPSILIYPCPDFFLPAWWFFPQNFISFNINFILNIVMLPPTGLLIVSVTWRECFFIAFNDSKF